MSHWTILSKAIPCPKKPFKVVAFQHLYENFLQSKEDKAIVFIIIIISDIIFSGSKKNFLRSAARKQNTIKFVMYIAEQAHELQNNSVQMWEKKKLLKLQSFADSFILRTFSSLLSL